jgi:hypothetical protein
MADLAKGINRVITKIFVKLKFSTSPTTVERAGLAPSLGEYRKLLAGICADRKKVRLMGVGVRFASAPPTLRN